MRTQPRYQLSASADIAVYLMRAEQDVDSAQPVQVLDLSKGGAKLGMSEPLAIKDQVSVRLVSEALQTTIDIHANVCWARPMGDGRWWMGCAFDPPIPDREICQLALAGCIERRQDLRNPLEVAAVARWELEPQPVEILMLDLSSGGFAMMSPKEPKVGDRILLTLENDNPEEKPIVARIQWYLTAIEGFKIGCEFLGKDGFAECRRRMADRAPTTKKSRYRSVRYWAALVAGVALVAAGGYLLTL